MKRTKKIVLTLMTSFSLVMAGCSKEQPTLRELYQSKEKCREDWGDDKRCEPVSQGGHAYYGPHYFYQSGRPYYFPSGSNDPVPAGSDMKVSSLRPGMTSPGAMGTTTSTHITRGGFGSSSHSGGS